MGVEIILDIFFKCSASVLEIPCNRLPLPNSKSLPGHHLSLTTSSQALESLNKKDLTEMKSYDRPPALVETVMQAVMTLLGKSPSWADAKKELGEKTDFCC